MHPNTGYGHLIDGALETWNSALEAEDAWTSAYAAEVDGAGSSPGALLSLRRSGILIGVGASCAMSFDGRELGDRLRPGVRDYAASP